MQICLPYAGGYNAAGGLLSSVELFSPSSDCSHLTVAPLPAPRRGLVAAWTGGAVLACGPPANSTKVPDTNIGEQEFSKNTKVTNIIY